MKDFLSFKSLSSQYCAINNDTHIFQKIQRTFFQKVWIYCWSQQYWSKQTLGWPSRPPVHNNSLRKAAVSLSMDPHEKSIAIATWGPLISYQAALSMWTELVQFFRSEKPAPTPQRPFISIANTATWRSPWMMRKLWSTWVGKNLQWSFKYTRRMPAMAWISSTYLPCIFPQIWSSSQ